MFIIFFQHEFYVVQLSVTVFYLYDGINFVRAFFSSFVVQLYSYKNKLKELLSGERINIISF